MFRKALFAVILALPLAWASPAQASNILFDPDGAGGAGAISIDLWDLVPGNVIAVNGGGAGGITAGDPVQSLFQANLGLADNTALPGTSYANGGFGVYYTVVAGIPEVVTSVTNTVSFDIVGGTPVAPTATNYFYIYATTNPAEVTNNDLNGYCFTCGTLILSGVFIDNANFSNSFTPATVQTNPPLDGFGANNYPGTTTLTGTGGLNADILVTSTNTAYFPSLGAGAVILWIADTQNNLPFDQANPSACFNPDGLGAVTSCVGQYPGAGNANIGPINGEGQDIMLQSDASFSFRVEQVGEVPEPATLTLLGLGLVGSAAARRRQRKANANKK